MPEDALDTEYIIDKTAIVDSVTQKLQKACDITGGFDTVLVIAHDWNDRAKMHKSMELCAKEIIPQLP